MRNLVLIPLLFLLGCGGAAKDLIGSWEFDVATYELVQKFREISPKEQQHWVETAHMNLTITASGIVWEQSLPGWGARSTTGTYTVVDVDGARVTVDAEFEDVKKKKRYVFTVDENRLRFGLGGRSIILKRQAPSKP
ncbi:MAG: hypothetical protein OER88_08155 [Planctomycetota bacterium]|nr:hypothetical protein [Planctomycetota bacterium]